MEKPRGGRTISEEYDLRKSSEKVGELYPVILSKDGEIIDGFHRKNAKTDWRTEIREEIDSPEKLIKARLIANKFRRQVSAQEVEGWINELAEIALTEYEIEPGKISAWVVDETGYAQNTVMRYLDNKFKLDYSNRPQSKPHITTEVMKSDVLHEMGRELGEGVRRGLIQLNEDIKANAPRRRLVSNLFNLKNVNSSLKSKSLYNPFNPDAYLIWSDGRTLDETISEMERLIK